MPRYSKSFVTALGVLPMTLVRLSLVLFGLLATATVAVTGQGGDSAVRGRVVDDQKAVLPGAAIVVTNQETGAVRETISGQDGSYFVTSLPPGPYRITAELAGFRPLTRDDVILRLGATSTVDLQLALGGIAESVTVTGDTAQVDLTSSQGGGSIAPGELQDLPSANRGYVSLVALLPGVQYVADSGGDPSVNINGQHDSQVTYVLDGGNNNDDSQGGAGGAQTRVNIESVQEFQVITNQFDAEHGRSTGGIVNAITKGGTNNFRGSAFGFFTDSAYTTMDPFVKRSGGGIAKPDSKKYQWGGTIGGPIVRDKTHFFLSLERVQLDYARTFVFPTRPSLSHSSVEKVTFTNLLGRVDHILTPNNSLSFRWVQEPAPNRGKMEGRVTETARNHEIDKDIAANASYNVVLSSTRVNTMRASFTREDIKRGPETDSYWDNQYSGPRDGTALQNELPMLRFLSFDDQNTQQGQDKILDNYSFDDTFSWFVPGKRGDHDLKFGMQYVFGMHDYVEAGSSNGIFTFAGDAAFNASNPSTYPERLTIRVPGAQLFKPLSHALGLFAQDKWRLTNKLTMSLGLRWDINVVPISAGDFNPLFSNRDDYPVDKNNFQPRAGFAYNIDGKSVLRGGAGIFHSRMWFNHFQNSMTQGVYTSSFIANFPVSGPDPGPSRGQLPTDPLLVNGPVVNRDLLRTLVPYPIRNSAAVTLDNPDRINPSTRQVSLGFERQLRPMLSFGADYVHNWGKNEGIQYDLNPAVRASTGRTAAIVRTDLLGIADQLAISPFLNSVRITEYVGESQYDGLNLQLEKRFANAWQGRVSYTIGYVRGNTGGAPIPVNNFQVLGERNLDLNYGPNDADRRHIFSVSGRFEVPRIHGLNVSGVFRAMTGRPFTIHDTNFDLDRNGILFDPLPAGTYSGVGDNAWTVENKGGRNGAVGHGYANLDARVSYRFRLATERTLDLFVEIFNVTDEPNYVNPTGDRRSPDFLNPTDFEGGGAVPRQGQIGIRLGF